MIECLYAQIGKHRTIGIVQFEIAARYGYLCSRTDACNRQVFHVIIVDRIGAVMNFESVRGGGCVTCNEYRHRAVIGNVFPLSGELCSRIQRNIGRIDGRDFPESGYDRLRDRIRVICDNGV